MPIRKVFRWKNASFVIVTPAFKILANDKDITAKIATSLQSITIKDGRGLDGDTLTIRLDDSKADFALPPKGATLQVSIGWQGQRLYYKGKFKVDKFAHDGPPDVLVISAKPADFLSTIKERRSVSYDDTTLSDVIRTVANRNNLKAAVSAQFASVKIDHIDQVDESDIHFITRLAQQYDAVSKPANESLLFTAKGTSTTASGQALPPVTITRSDTIRHSWQEQDRDAYTGARAYWQNTKNATRTGEYAGSKDRVKTLPGTFPSQAEAKAAANAALSNLTRLIGTLDLTLKLGRPEIIAETPCPASGFRDYIDGDYVVDSVTQTLHAGTGINTQLKLELSA